jgi:hypothetical protein
VVQHHRRQAARRAARRARPPALPVGLTPSGGIRPMAGPS